MHFTSIITLSWNAAFVFQRFLDNQHAPVGHLHSNGLSPWTHAAGGAPLSVLAYSYRSMNYRNRLAPATAIDEWGNPETATNRTQEMTCSHCNDSATQGLMNLPGIHSVNANLKWKISKLEGLGIDPEAISKKLDSIEYSVANYSLEKKQH